MTSHLAIPAALDAVLAGLQRARLGSAILGLDGGSKELANRAPGREAFGLAAKELDARARR